MIMYDDGMMMDGADADNDAADDGAGGANDETC